MFTKNKIKNLIENLLKDGEFDECVFFIYSDGIGWGCETFKNGDESKREAEVAQMWWDIAHRSFYNLEIKDKTKFGFVFTGYADQLKEENKSNPMAMIDKMHMELLEKLEENKIFKARKLI